MRQKEKDMIEVLKEIGSMTDATIYNLLEKESSENFFDAVKFLITTGGKRVRPALTLLFCEAAGGIRKEAYGPAAGIELLHNYSLIMDDIIDNSTLRRGNPTVWKKYGIPIALLIGMHYREAAFEATKQVHNAEQINELFSQAIRAMIEGERLDILFEQAGRTEPYILQHRYQDVTRDAYFDMIGRKTAEIIKVACQAGVLCAYHASKELLTTAGKYGWNAGLAFQLIDDYLDLFAQEEKFGKEIGKDIKEHKLGNLVIIYSLEELEEERRNKLLNIIRQEKPDQKDVSWVISTLKSTNGPVRVKKEAKRLEEEAKNAIAVFPDSEAKQLLIDLVEFIVDRTY
ncbi:MAG: polyprenyl synthetase family protein [Candidatus Heimdallarchaeota archaeon]